MCARRRIGLYGGTFDPVHQGHLDVARRVGKLFEIDEILFVPAQLAPHKLVRPVTPAIHRYAMLVLATKDDPQLRISTFELDAPDRRYTVDTLTHFQLTLVEDELFFIMGADSWADIETWRNWEQLLTMTNHIVVTRPGHSVDIEHSPFINRIIDMRGRTQISELKDARTPQIFITDVVMDDIAATDIRRFCREGRFDELRGSVPDAVIEYLQKYQIYRNSNEAKLNS
ncbi:MAG TPA: nicotinate-nucleotide adenylyltransferase [Pyrinomonadaceae bacterium]|nr:nicotinate-nucleotide adenylyltransferase [Pyrinomonadaceae bacterium]